MSEPPRKRTRHDVINDLNRAEQAQREQRAAHHAAKTPAEREAIRARIKAQMLNCGKKNVITDPVEENELIDRYGLLPIINTYDWTHGIDPDDVVFLHGECVQKSKVIAFLHTVRDKLPHYVGNRRLTPAIHDGEPITKEDMQVLGLDPMQYRFFNEELKRVHPINPADALELDALASAAIGDMVVLGDEDDDDVRDEEGNYPSITAAEHVYLRDLAAWSISYEDFVRLLAQPYSLRRPGDMFVNIMVIDPAQLTLISNMTTNFHNHDIELATQQGPAVAAERQRLRALLLRKIDYLLEQWRWTSGRGYNVFINYNVELLTPLRHNDIHVVVALLRYVRSLGLAFIDRSNQLTDRLDALRASVRENQADRAIWAEIEQLRMTTVVRGPSRLARMIERRLQERFERWLYSKASKLVQGTLASFQRLIPMLRSDISEELVYDSLDPLVRRGATQQAFSPEDVDLVSLLIEQPQKLLHLVEYFRIKVGGRVRAIDLTANIDSRYNAIRVLIGHANRNRNNIALLRQVLALNRVNERQRIAVKRLSNLPRGVQQNLIAMAESEEIRTVLREFFTPSIAYDDDDDDTESSSSDIEILGAVILGGRGDDDDDDDDDADNQDDDNPET